MIVGHKIEQYQTARRIFGEPWEVTTHRVVTELHSTKGWRPVGHTRQVELVGRLPTIRAWRAANVTGFQFARMPKDRKPDFIDTMKPAARERSLMRHGWYRRKLRNEVPS